MPNQALNIRLLPKDMIALEKEAASRGFLKTSLARSYILQALREVEQHAK